MEHEDYYKERSHNKIEIGQQEELVGAVAPQLVDIPLEVQVVPVAENPEPPSSSQTPPSPVLESPPQQLGDAPSFMGFLRAMIW